MAMPQETKVQDEEPRSPPPLGFLTLGILLLTFVGAIIALKDVRFG